MTRCFLSIMSGRRLCLFAIVLATAMVAVNGESTATTTATTSSTSTSTTTSTTSTTTTTVLPPVTPQIVATEGGLQFEVDAEQDFIVKRTWNTGVPEDSIGLFGMRSQLRLDLTAAIADVTAQIDSSATSLEGRIDVVQNNLESATQSLEVRIDETQDMVNTVQADVNAKAATLQSGINAVAADAAELSSHVDVVGDDLTALVNLKYSDAQAYANGINAAIRADVSSATNSLTNAIGSLSSSVNAKISTTDTSIRSATSNQIVSYVGQREADIRGDVSSQVGSISNGLATTIRNYVNKNCRLFIGYTDSCDGCTSVYKKGWANGDGACQMSGSDSTCSNANIFGYNVKLLGINTDGDVNGDDKFYIGFRCQ
eukprot:m.353622 g.353622  ORF g.353622 m.353622 type:complete len:371 (+) comp16807_c0_seq1:220-1332(+)